MFNLFFVESFYLRYDECIFEDFLYKKSFCLIRDNLVIFNGSRFLMIEMWLLFWGRRG